MRQRGNNTDMPKVHDTRKQKAKELLRMVTNGPSFSLDFPFSSPERDKYLKLAEKDYRLWSSSWIIPKLKELIPELKEKQ
jgi:hypothetical protein